MILKARKPAAEAEDERGDRRKRRSRKDPVDVQLSVSFRFGDEPEDRVTMIDQRRIPMVGGLLANRDRIIRGFVTLLTRTALTQPRLARQLFPLARLVPTRKSKSKSKK